MEKTLANTGSIPPEDKKISKSKNVIWIAGGTDKGNDYHRKASAAFRCVRN